MYGGYESRVYIYIYIYVCVYMCITGGGTWLMIVTPCFAAFDSDNALLLSMDSHPIISYPAPPLTLDNWDKRSN